MTGYCDPNYTKQQEFSNAQNHYERSVFLILVLLGVASLVLGVTTDDLNSLSGFCVALVLASSFDSVTVFSAALAFLLSLFFSFAIISIAE